MTIYYAQETNSPFPYLFNDFNYTVIIININAVTLFFLFF